MDKMVLSTLKQRSYFGSIHAVGVSNTKCYVDGATSTCCQFSK